jgi:hypothetical protein
MAKTTPLGVRLNPETKAALDKAAKDEARSLSNLIERVLTEWLKAKGYLK